jgi:hypothetical protein
MEAQAGAPLGALTNSRRSRPALSDFEDDLERGIELALFPGLSGIIRTI